MDSYSANDAHYGAQQQRWPPHLMGPTSHQQGPFPSPPSSSISDHGQHYPPFYNSQQQSSSANGDQSHQHLPRTNSSLSLNLSSLSVASPTNLSPINPPSGGTASALSPVTPISPSNQPFPHHHHHNSLSHSMSSSYQYDPANTGPASGSFEQDMTAGSSSASNGAVQNYDHSRPLRITTQTSRPSSANSASMPPSRKRSFTSNPSSAAPLLEEPSFDDSNLDTPMDVGFDENSDLRYPASSSTPGAGGGGTSPIDAGSGSGEESASGTGQAGSVGGSMGMIGGKPMATNNFVTKLYQMINDPKSAHFIAWTEIGTSFVVSNVGEFSRSILGSHFKHNNFSSFVRQLNMYGFHKINRTPRAQRTSSDVQTWEFSHHKFLRNRPDLLDEIKRKALEPDPSVKHRVELPGEVAAQLSTMREENRRVWDQLLAEKRKVEKLTSVVNRLWEVVGKCFPGHVPPFPADLLDGLESPNIFITSPTATTSRGFPPPMGISAQTLHTMHSLSPASSPTTAEFPVNQHHHAHHHAQQAQHQQHPHSLSRQQSYQHIGYQRGNESPGTLPASPAEMSMDLFDDGPGDGDGVPTGRGSAKRQRMSNDDVNGGMNGLNGDMIPSPASLASPLSSLASGTLSPPKKTSRARSDSAPLSAYGGHNHGINGNGLTGQWPVNTTGRPRSGSGMMMQPQLHQQQHRGFGMQNPVNNAPMLSITVPSNGPISR